MSLFIHAFRSPTNELNTEETWKRLDEVWLFKKQGNDIVPYDYRRSYQRKQQKGRESSNSVCGVPRPSPGKLDLGLNMCNQMSFFPCFWQLPIFLLLVVSLACRPQNSPLVTLSLCCSYLG